MEDVGMTDNIAQKKYEIKKWLYFVWKQSMNGFNAIFSSPTMKQLRETLCCNSIPPLTATIQALDAIAVDPSPWLSFQYFLYWKN